MKRTFYIILLVLFSALFSCKNKQEEDLNSKHLDYIANSINNDLIEIKKDIITLANDVQHKISFEKKVTSFSTDKYHYYPGQVLFCTYKESQSAVYYPANKNIDKSIKNIIVNSEQIDAFFIGTIKKNPLLAQVYFLDTNSFLRIYPYINVVNYLKSSVNLTDFMTFRKVKQKPYIEDHAYWMNIPYADPYGRGWIISCVQPIYYHDKFLGIVSGDFTLHSLKDKYLTSDTQLLLLTDNKGKLICCTREASKVANIPAIREFRYYKPVTETIFMNNNPCLKNHKNKTFRKAINSLLAGENKETFFVDNKKYTIYKSHIPETDWLLLKIIN